MNPKLFIAIFAIFVALTAFYFRMLVEKEGNRVENNCLKNCEEICTNICRK